MFYGFEGTRDEHACTGALVVYGLYRSRDVKRFKVTPDMWGIISRAVSGCAFRSIDLWQFVEKMKPKLHVSELNPKWTRVGINPTVSMVVNRETGEVLERGKAHSEQRRQFLTEILETADHEAVLAVLAKKTSLVIALVRDRLEREKPYEAELTKAGEDGVVDVEFEATV
ncbi:MAG: hypothetical protein RDU41_05930 [Clostridia bacterium]|nr:hypothetical protein [Clostridia bacterium]